MSFGWSDSANKSIAEKQRAITAACARDHREHWRVYQRYGNASAFSGYHWTWSEYSGIVCLSPGCERGRWRTKAAYVAEIPDLSDAERARLRGYGR